VKYLPFVLFFSLALGVLALSHFFVFVSWSKFFNFSINTRRYIGVLFIALTCGFIFSAWLSHFNDTIWSRGLYQLTATWLGLFSNLFWLTIIAWPLYLVGVRYLNQGQLNILVILLLSLALIATLFGYFNAKNIYYRQETVKINKLPAGWQGKRLALLSDVHLNNIHDEKFLRPIIEELNKKNITAVLLTGDFFDGMDGELDNLVKPLKDLKTENGTYFISGNHETYMGLARAEKALSDSGVKILDDKKIIIDGLSIAGVRFPERDGLRRDLVGEIVKMDLQSPSIFLYHDPREVEQIAATGRVDLMLSGHTHNGQLWPYNFLVRWIYGIYGIGLHQVGEMTQFTTTGVGTWGPPIRTSGRPEVVIFTLQ
jgi:predicted MPP superfamily phosphohydrolase